jgi:hypothetical protein
LTTKLPWSAIRIGYAGEGALSQDRIKEKLGQGEVTAVLSTDGKLIDEFWLQNFKSTVFVIRGVKLPPEIGHGGYGGYGGHGYGMPVPITAPIRPQAPAAPPPPPAAVKKNLEG